ncbi:helix-turn-helix domain-containing protein [Adlercreutzia rubneri]
MLEYSSFLLLCTHFRQYFDMLRCSSNSATKPCKGADMPIIPRLDRVMADRKMSVNELSQRIDISPVNISRMRRGHIKAVRFSTMERICEVLQCQPGDLFEHVSPEPGTDEAVELDAIINRPIEEPARKPIGAVSRIPVNVAN